MVVFKLKKKKKWLEIPTNLKAVGTLQYWQFVLLLLLVFV